MAPARLTRPYVGLRPTTPQHAAGSLMEPPVSLPSVASANPAATAAAEPLLEPPAQCPGVHGWCTSPWWALSPNGPIASSVMLSLPRVTAPASRSRAVAVHSLGTVKYSRVLVPHDVGRPGI